MTGRAGRAVAVAVATLTAVATVPLLALPAAAADADRRGAGTIVVRGHGYGHGHGMSQYGAEGAARAGRSSAQILRFYYPRTTPTRVGGRLRVLLTVDTTSAVTVLPAPRLRVRDLARGRTWLLPTKSTHARQWRIAPSGGNAAKSAVQLRNRSGWHRWNPPGKGRLLRGDGQFRARGPVRLVLPGGSVRAYRGILRSASPTPGSGTRDTVNVVSLDQYIRGVLAAEMPSSWSRAALRAQAVAARSFAAYWRRAAAGDHWQVCDTTTCQVYGGVAAETRRTNAAVISTASTILTHRGAPALTQFSSSSGGWTSYGHMPYLPAKADPFDDWAGNGYHDWRRRIPVASIQGAYPRLGRLQAIRAVRRDGHGEWGGRVLLMRLRGSKGSVLQTGDDLRWALGLPSTWFAFGPVRR
jgi:SpoIID/LytB domain protein